MCWRKGYLNFRRPKRVFHSADEVHLHGPGAAQPGSNSPQEVFMEDVFLLLFMLVPSRVIVSGSLVKSPKTTATILPSGWL